MSEWEAANLLSSPRKYHRHDRNYQSDSNDIIPCRDFSISSNSSSDQTFSHTETKEEILLRLNSSYSSAMRAITTVHSASTVFAQSFSMEKSNFTSAPIMDCDEMRQQKRKTNHYNNGFIRKENSTFIKKNDSISPKTDNIFVQGDEKYYPRNDRIEAGLSIQRAATTARSLLESELLDPHLVKYAPTFSQTISSSVNGNFHITMHKRSGLILPDLTISLHQSTLKELAYLSLLNFADLLICGCSCVCYRSRTSLNSSILDRGFVRVLDALVLESYSCGSFHKLSKEITCLWSDREIEEHTRLLALVAYCDAADIDGSDPTLWLKLASTARALRKVRQELITKKYTPPFENDNRIENKVLVNNASNDANNEAVNLVNNAALPLSSIKHVLKNDFMPVDSRQNSNYRKLEMYALERGMMVFPSRITPNRTLKHALGDLNNTMGENMLWGKAYKAIEQEIGTVFVIDLPLYSWYTLGKTLLSAFHQLDTLNSKNNGNITSSHIRDQKSLHREGYPHQMISFQMPPLLTLPSTALRTVCEFLGNDNLNLKSTCRCLSMEVTSVDFFIEERLSLQLGRRKNCLIKEKVQGGEGYYLSSKDFHKHGAIENKNLGKESIKSEKAVLSKKRKRKKIKSYRSSKRVRSQLITSGKQANKSAKRRSVEYCLVSVLLSCTVEHPIYREALNNKIDWNCLLTPKLRSKFITSFDETMKPISTPHSSTAKLENRKQVSKEKYLSRKSSLQMFVEKWNNNNSGPDDMLQRYLAYVSCNIEEVFSKEDSNIVILSSCLIECLEMFSRSTRNNILCPLWYGDISCFSDIKCVFEHIEGYAINLLNTELRLLRIVFHGLSCTYFHDDLISLRSIMPILLQYSENFEVRDIMPSMQVLVNSLHVRTHWLISFFNVWWNKLIPQRKDSDLIIQALRHIEKAIILLKEVNSVKTISSLDLKSSETIGNYLTELTPHRLLCFRNELESSIVLSRCKREFVNLQNKISHEQRSKGIKSLSQYDREQLYLLGKDLIQRYMIESDHSVTRKTELALDFISVHGAGLLLDAYSNEKVSNVDILSHLRWKSQWNLIPSSSSVLCCFEIISTPSLFSIVSICIQCKENCSIEYLTLMAETIMIIFEKQRELLSQNKVGECHDVIYRSIPEDNISYQSELDTNGHTKTSNKRNIHIFLQAGKYLLSKLADIITNCHKFQTIIQFYKSGDFETIVFLSLVASSGFYDEFNFSEEKILELSPDKELLMIILSLVSVVINALKSQAMKDSLLAFIFTMLVIIITQERRVLPCLLHLKIDNNFGRKARQIACYNLGDYIALLCSEIAALLSTHGSIYHRNKLVEDSLIVNKIIGITNSKSLFHFMGISPMVKLIESITWFWNFMLSSEVIGNDSAVVSSISSLDRSVAKYLIVPVSSVIVTLCGSTRYDIFGFIAKDISQHTSSNEGESFVMSDYFDTDDSVRKYASDDNINDVQIMKLTKESSQFMSTFCRIIQCIGLVYSIIDDKIASLHVECFLTLKENKSPFLPLLVTRLLTNISDFVLQEFSFQENSSCGNGIWALDYPYGFRSAGLQLDSLLHKSYRILHGFNLASQNHQVSIGRDTAMPSGTSFLIESSKHVIPESSIAAAQLYRCIIRSYANIRRPPPKEALECVALALPPVKESDRSKAIRKYVFQVVYNKTNHPQEKEFDLYGNKIEIDDVPCNFPLWVFDMSIKGGISSSGYINISEKYNSKSEKSPEIEEEELYLVRKGISEKLAEGPLPRIGCSVQTKMEETTSKNMNEERENTVQTDIELCKKIHAILDSLCYDAFDCRKWFRVGLCLGMKTDIIINRVVTSKSTYNAGNFFIPPGFLCETSRQISIGVNADSFMTLRELLRSQYDIYKQQMNSRVDFLGHELSCYVEAQWSNFLGLKRFSDKLGDTLICSGNNLQQIDDSERLPWNLIQTKYENGQYADWQKAWGSIMISALQTMTKRCLSVALFIAKQKKRGSVERNLYPEISEVLGTEFYSEIMGSKLHGFPIMLLSEFEKRKKAQFAKACFQKAIDFSLSSNEGNKVKFVGVWDLYFMVGKCKEKIARSLFVEKILSLEPQRKGDFFRNPNQCRAYEFIMNSCLMSYSIALSEAKKCGKEDTLSEYQFGGSSHGITELFYRIHATRLKVLLLAIKVSREIRIYTELEALRITEKYWFEEQERRERTVTSMNVRKRVWVVLADVVAAMTYCRRKQQYFHRSVYRHAQALLWAPMLNDPYGALHKGSLSTVSATKSYKLRGLNSGSCANSAEAIISQLFDKKRLQLCAVWVTTPTSPSPFQVINEADRKYDSLRWKYIEAFIDSMKLCKRRETLEVFLSWSDSCRRDLPSFYDASAATKGDNPNQLHIKDKLIGGNGFLCSIMRHANKAVANIIKSDVIELKSMLPRNDKRYSILNLFESAYKCFLRLNCPIDSEFWHTQKVKIKMVKGLITEVDALCEAYYLECDSKLRFNRECFHASINEDIWIQKLIVLNLALGKCNILFPSVLNQHGARKRKGKRITIGKDNI